jgi:hypothetical protein
MLIPCFTPDSRHCIKNTKRIADLVLCGKLLKRACGGEAAFWDTVKSLGAIS